MIYIYKRDLSYRKVIIKECYVVWSVIEWEGGWNIFLKERIWRLIDGKTVIFYFGKNKIILININ
jgi:hypothetical protein